MNEFRFLLAAWFLGTSVFWGTEAFSQEKAKADGAPKQENADEDQEKKPPKPPKPLTAKEAKTLYDSLYAGKVQAALRTPIKKDDMEEARVLLELAEDNMAHPNLVALMAQAAYDLTVKLSTGHEVALQATGLLAEVVPKDQQLQVAENRLSLLKKKYTAVKSNEREEVGKGYIEQLMAVADHARDAEDIASALRHYQTALSVASRIRYEDRDQIEEARKQVIAQKSTYDKIAGLKRRLNRDKKDVAAVKELVTLYTVALDQPLQAKKYTFLLQDKTLAANVSLAAMNSEEWQAQEAYSLAQWYSELNEEHDNPVHLLERAITAYERYLAETEDAEGDVKRVVAGLKLKDLGAKYEQATEPKAVVFPRGRMVNLAKHVYLKRHVVKGNWLMSGGRLAVRFAGDAVLRLPVQPNGDYQFQMVMERTTPGGTVAVTLPVKDRMVNFVMGDGYGGFYYSAVYGGLSRVDRHGVTSRSNPTRSGGSFRNNRRHTFVISVMEKGAEDVRIHATYNGKLYFDWTGPVEDLSQDHRWELSKTPSFGVGVTDAQATFHVLRFKMLKGTAKVLKSSDFAKQKE